MSIIQEFKDFINKGNLIDFAVGVVVGAAFTKVTDSFMSAIVNPLIGLIGGADFSNQFVILKGAEKGTFPTIADAQKAGQVVLGYGAFISAVLSFLITAFVMFLVVKAYNKMKAKTPETPAEPAAPPEPTNEEKLLTEIRDLLKK